MTPDERREIARRLQDEVWNKGNVDALDSVIVPDCSYHDPRFPVEGLAGIKQRARELRAAQPDLHTEVHQILVDGDMTATRWTQSGTASREFRGLPATGRTYAMDGVTIDRWEGDRIVEVWLVYDLFGALEQLGVIPETLLRETASSSRLLSRLGGPPVQMRQAMTSEERKDKLRWVEEEVWNKGNVDAHDDVIAPDFLYHDPRFPVEGLAGAKQRAGELLAAQPDLHMEVHEVLGDGDLTAYRWTQSGTARGEFRGVPATGKSYAMVGVNIDRWEGDRIVEGWIVYDLVGALEQLGVIPELPRHETTE